MSRSNKDGRKWFSIWEGGAVCIHQSGNIAEIVFDAEAQTWYHIVYTMEAGVSLKLYVGGELRSEAPGGGAEPENWHERRIGSEHDGRFLNGMIDNVRVYNRVLEPEEVQQNFNARSTGAAVKPGDKLASCCGDIKL